jgi:hypothetical protein
MRLLVLSACNKASRSRDARSFVLEPAIRFSFAGYLHTKYICGFVKPTCILSRS